VIPVEQLVRNSLEQLSPVVKGNPGSRRIGP